MELDGHFGKDMGETAKMCNETKVVNDACCVAGAN